MHVFWEVALRHRTLKLQALGQLRRPWEIRKEFLKDIKEQVVLLCAQSCPRQTFILSSPSQLDGSTTLISFSATVFTSSATPLVHVLIIFTWINSNNILTGLLFCFVVSPLSTPSSPPFIHSPSESSYQSLPLRSNPHPFKCLFFLDSPFSSHISKAILPTSHPDSYFQQWTCQTFSCLCALVHPVPRNHTHSSPHGDSAQAYSNLGLSGHLTTILPQGSAKSNSGVSLKFCDSSLHQSTGPCITGPHAESHTHRTASSKGHAPFIFVILNHSVKQTG